MRLRNIGAFFIFYLSLLINLQGQNTLYWVGGSGDWFDISHWSPVSGGNGGFNVPDATFNVVFDENSFDAPAQIVTVGGMNLTPACTDMDWRAVTNNPTFDISELSHRLNIEGSIWLSADMTWNVSIPVTMSSSDPGKVILSAGIQFQNDLIFNGFGGEWTLSDALDINGNMQLETGAFISNDQRIFVTGGIIADSGLDIIIDLGTSSVAIFSPNPAPGLLTLDGDFIDLRAQNSTISIVGEDAIVRLNADVPLQFGVLEFATQEALVTTTNYTAPTPLPFFDQLRFLGNGKIEGSHVIFTLALTNGRTVFLQPGITQFITDLVTTSSACDGDAGLMVEFGSNERATIDFDLGNSFVGPFNLRGIEGISRGGLIFMTDGIDSGNNSDNFQFAPPPARTLYWVGDGGSWEDPNHWSESPGGPGGACIPKSVDDVVFDEFSFPGNTGNSTVLSSVAIFVNSFTFISNSNSGQVPVMNLPSLYITEDLTITQEVMWLINNVYLIGKDVGGNTSNTDNQNIDVIPGILRNLIVRGDAGSRVRLIRDLNIQFMLDIGGNGTFDSQGFNITTQTFFSVDANVVIDLDNSTIRVTGTSNPNLPLKISNVTSFSGVGTQWLFTAENSGFDIDMIDEFGSVTFTSTTGISTMIIRESAGIGTLDIMNDGEFVGLTYTIDSLILHPGPSRTYVLNVGVEISVSEYFEALNDLCNTLRITTPNTVEQITLAADIELQMAFVTIENVTAAGGGDFFAGEGSSGIGTTTGWRFPSEADNLSAEEFLGNDIVACGDSVITLETPDQLEMVVWRVNGSDRTTGPTYQLMGDETEIIANAETTTGCPASDTIIVTLAQPFTIELDDNRDVCQGSVALLDPGFNDPAATYLWNTGDMTPTITVDSTATYQVTISRDGCVETDAVTITRIELEPFSLGGDTTLCHGDSYIIPDPGFARPSTSFMWNDGRTTGPLTISENTLPANGIYFIEVSEGECSDRDSIIVSFDAAITQVLTNDMDTTLCEGDAFDLKVLAGFDSVLWSTNETDFSITVNTEEIFTVEAFRGACMETASRDVQVATIAPFNLGGDVTICENQELQLFKPSNVVSDIVWIEGGSEVELSMMDTIDVNIIPGATTDYILEAREGICARRDTQAVTVELAPIIMLGQDTTLCQGSALDLTLPADLDDFTWSDGNMTLNNTVSTAETISVIAERGRCTVFDTIVIAILDLTALDIGPTDTTLCQGDNLMLDATLPGSVNYSWSPSNAGSVFNVFTPGDYMVTVSASGCDVADSISVSYDDAPNFDLHQVPGAVDSTICAGDILAYNFNIPNASYSWSSFAGDELSNQNAFNISEVGGYTLEVTRGACIITDSLNISIQSRPELNLTDTILTCLGEVITLDATFTGATYQWNNTETTATIDVVQTGNYIVTSMASGCPNTDTSYVLFNNRPNISLPFDQAICDGDSMVLSITNTGLDFDWQSPSGVIMDASVIAKIEGDYILSATNEDNCTSIDTFTLTINPTPFFNLPDSTGLCDGNATTLEVVSAFMPTRYRWSTADGNSSIEVRTEGEYSVDAFILTNGEECSWSDTTYVSVQPIPVATIGDDATICADSVLRLDATLNGATYEWSTGETTPTIDVTMGGTYTVTVDVRGCTDMEDVAVTTIPVPVVELGMDTSICDGEILTLSTGIVTGNTLWSTGETSSTIDVMDGATYTVRVAENGCDTEDNITVDINPIPVFDLGDDIAICDQIGVTLVAEVPGATIAWSTGESGSAINVGESGSFSAMATSDAGCTFEDFIDVAQRECLRFSVYRPNVFSPGAAASLGNAVFKVSPGASAIIHSYSIKIFNRWGNLMYTSNDFNEGWTGRAKGEGSDFANPGVYSYVIEIMYSDDFDSNRTDVLHGTVTLIN